MPTSSRGRTNTARLRPFLVWGLGMLASPAIADEPEGDRAFREKIRPVLEASCFGCNSAAATKVKGGLLLASREGMLRGGETGPAIVPGKAADSLLIQAIRHEDGLAMPPKKPKLADSVIDDFAQWVD